MIISNIYPIKNQNFYKQEKIVMLLAHLFNYYNPENFDSNQWIMLDNGIYENAQVSTNLSDLIMMAEKSPIPINEFIVPDKFFDYKGNIELFEKNRSIIEKWSYKYSFMVSLHHWTFEEFCYSMNYMKQYNGKLNLVMGIPKKARFNRQSEAAIEQYANCPYPIHFLGLTDTDPLNELLKVKDLIRSCDTSQLVTMLKNSNREANLLSYVRKPKDTPIDLEKDVFNDEDIEYCLKNNDLKKFEI